jgi:RHS repeat-associated protein
VSKVTDANNNAEAAAYNAQSNATQLTDAMTSPGITALSYDLNNNLTSITSPASGGSSASQTLGYSTPGTINGGTYLPSSNKDAQGNCTSYTYDTPGNLQGSTAGQGPSCTGAGTTTSTNAYQGDGSTSCGGKTGELCSVTDGNGHVTTYGYDANGEVTSVTPPSPQGATTLTYDALSRPHTVATPTGTATYTYDVWDRITVVAYTSGPTASYTYDADGNLKQRVDPSGTTTFSYDTLNRLTAEHLPSGADGCSGSLTTGITLGYDAASNITTYCDGAGTTTYGYDPGNRVTRLAEPGGSCPSTPTFPNSTLCTAFAYNNDNMRTTTTYPGGATLAAGYDPAGDQTSAVGKAAAGGTALTSYAYSYANGTNQTQLRQSMTENDTSVSNVTTNLGYSAQNQLLSATNTTTNTAQEYYYDPAGNRCNANTSSPPSAITSCTSPTYNYNSANQLTSGPAGSYTYDSSGQEQTSPQLSNLTYNTAAQTNSITPSGMSAVAHSYADIGQSLLTADGSTSLFNGPLGLDRATVGGTNTYFVRDPQGNVIGEKTGASATLYFLKDALGSVTAAINGAGSTVSDRFSYDAYGNQTVVSGSTYEPIGYAGGYYNGNTGLTKFGTRYYDATTGRWTQMDPIGGSLANPSTLNGYIYAGDDPVNNADPSGRCSLGDVLLGINDALDAVAATAGAVGLVGLSGLLGIETFGASLLIGISAVGLLSGAGALFFQAYEDVSSCF